MPNKSKAENAEALQAAGIPRRSFSVPEFCARHGISPGLYGKMKRMGLGPREIALLNRTVITREDEDAWLRARRAESGGAVPVAEREHV